MAGLRWVRGETEVQERSRSSLLAGQVVVVGVGPLRVVPRPGLGPDRGGKEGVF